MVKQINPLATVLRTEYARVGDLKQLLGIKAFRLDRVLDRDAGFLDFRPYRIHDQSVESVALVGNGAVDSVLLEKWVQKTILTCGEGLLRTKGVFTVQGGDKTKPKGGDAEVVVQGVRQMVDFQPRTAEDDSDTKEGEKSPATPLPAEEHKNKLILIGHGLEDKVEAILASFREDVQLAQWRAAGGTDETVHTLGAKQEPYMGVYEPAMNVATRADFIRMAVMVAILIMLYYWD
jgi:G3E family GTPase